MSCFYPLIAFPRKITEKGKVQYIPIPRKGNEDLYNSVINSYVNDERLSLDGDIMKAGGVQSHKIIPCGKCIGCRLDYSRNWAIRCMMEQKYHDSSFFVTLTYNDEMIPVRWYDTNDGKLPSYSLQKRDFQLWLKRLRAKIDYPIRFFGCGEYGSGNLRPHYHCIVFGLHLDDLKFYKNDGSGILYTSDFLSSTWVREYKMKEGEKIYKRLGFVIIGECSFNTCAYVARYTAKKAMTVGNEFFNKFNIEKPFIDMSRRPGIGAQYFEDNRELFNNNTLYMATAEKGIRFSMPRYFLSKLENIDPVLYNKIKESRSKSAYVDALAKVRSKEKSYTDLVKDMETCMIERSRNIKRSLC